jgi:hypothetical protein
MRLETGFISLKQGIISKGLSKAQLNLTLMLHVLREFLKSEQKKGFTSTDG